MVPQCHVSSPSLLLSAVQAVTLPPRRPPTPHLQLVDPFLQGAWVRGDGGFLGQRGLKASDDPVCLLDLPLQTQGSLGSAGVCVGERKGYSSSWPHPCGSTQPCPPLSPEHSLLPIEVAESLHVTVLVLDVVEDHGQVQGSRAHGPLRQECLTLLLGCLLLCPQALQLLGSALGRRRSGMCALGSGVSPSPPTRST